MMYLVSMDKRNKISETPVYLSLDKHLRLQKQGKIVQVGHKHYVPVKGQLRPVYVCWGACS